MDGPLRCLIDSMVFDAVVAEPGLREVVDRLTSARRVELLAAFDTMREIGATPDRARRRLLQRVRVLVLPPPDPRATGAATLLVRLARSPGISDEDARIALTAAQHGVPLVTEDRELRAAAADHLPGLALWRFEEDLRPRLVALAPELAARA